MSQYVERTLNKDEWIVMKAKKNPLCLAGVTIFMLAVFAVAIYLTVAPPWGGESNPNAVVTSQGDTDTIMYAVIWSIAVLVGVLPFVVRLLRFLSIDLAVTNKRVVGKVGVLRLMAVDTPIGKVDNILIKATILGRLFRYFNLRVVGAGHGGFDTRKRSEKDLFIGISNAEEFRNKVTEAIEKHAEEARRAQAEEIAMAMGRKEG